MSRPLKKGLDYFSLDCELDDKFTLIEADHGHVGFSVVIKLLQKIYSVGYYYDWGEVQQKLFASRVNVDINTLSAIVNACIKWGIFDEKTLAKHKVLTSRGIQKRYFAAIGRRANAHKATQFLLIDNNKPVEPELLPTETPKEPGIVPPESAESKVKKTKVKETKTPALSSADFSFPPKLDNELCRKALDEWITHRIESKKKPTPSTINKLLEKYRMRPVEFINGIENSIANGWQGVFDTKGPATNGAKSISTAQRTSLETIKILEQEELNEQPI